MRAARQEGEERFDRSELVRRGTGAALALGAGSVVSPLSSARAAGDRRLSILARELDGDLVVRGGRGYAQARLLWNARFDRVRPLGIAYAETVADLKRIVAFYKDRGYPDARVKSFDAKLNDTQTSVDITVNIARLRDNSIVRRTRRPAIGREAAITAISLPFGAAGAESASHKT